MTADLQAECKHMGQKTSTLPSLNVYSVELISTAYTWEGITVLPLVLREIQP